MKQSARCRDQMFGLFQLMERPNRSTRLMVQALIVFTFLSIAMQTTHGQIVINALTGDPVENANVIVDGSDQGGTSTLADGSFSLNVGVGTIIRITCVGYDPLTTPYEGSQQIILLERSITELNEIVIRADESEASRIIELCVANRYRHAPKSRPFFQCELYNKYRVTLLNDSTQRPSGLVRMLERKITGQTAFFSESAMTYSFEYPDRVEEHITANHVAGFDQAAFNFVPEQIAAFDINKDFLDILNRQFLLPVSKGSARHYGLHLEEAQITDGDTTWYIQFWPDRGSYDMVRGHMVIHSDGYALKEYRIMNSRTEHQRFDFFQEFEQHNGEWFPEKIFYTVVMKDPVLGINVLYDQRTFVSNPTFKSLKINAASANRIVFDEGVAEHPELIESLRREPLSTDDSLAITEISQTVDNLKVEQKMNIIANLSFGRLPLGPVDIDVPRLFWFTQVEGYRPGLSLVTNDKFNEHWGLEAFAGYGLNDELWKYGGGAFVHLNENESATLYGRYEKEVDPIMSYVVLNTGTSILANLYNQEANYYEGLTAGIRGRVAHWSYDLNYKQWEIEPAFEYQYKNANDDLLSIYDRASVSLGIKYVKRKYVPFYTYEIVLEDLSQTYMDLNIEHSSNDIMNSDVGYTKADLFIAQPIHFKHLGKTEIGIHTGFITGDRPIDRLHIANGSNRSGLPYQLPNAFNTMAPFTHFADRYVNVFMNYRIGRIYQSQFSAPYVHVALHSGWGYLSDPEDHLPLPLNDYRQGYHEGGLYLNNLLRYEPFSIFQIGLSFGAWMRYGYYYTGGWSDNVALKLGLSMGF